MNKQRRKQICQLKAELITIKEKLFDIQADEQNYFENMPENLQGSLRGSESEESIDVLDECIEKLEDVINKLYEMV